MPTTKVLSNGAGGSLVNYFQDPKAPVKRFPEMGTGLFRSSVA
jgi:hypothetical protein